jgi:hypothetical protein
MKAAIPTQITLLKNARTIARREAAMGVALASPRAATSGVAQHLAVVLKTCVVANGPKDFLHRVTRDECLVWRCGIGAGPGPGGPC